MFSQICSDLLGATDFLCDITDLGTKLCLSFKVFDVACKAIDVVRNGPLKDTVDGLNL